jgi:predicted CXXCH cytochrome family protein
LVGCVLAVLAVPAGYALGLLGGTASVGMAAPGAAWRVDKPSGPVPRGGCVTADCHGNIKAKLFLHGPVAADLCDACHEVASASEHTFRMPKTGGGLCNSCHELSTYGPVTHAPIVEGDCEVCHDPHGGQDWSMLRGDSVAENCITCHEDVVARMPVVHGPVAAGSCTACHRPHSAAHPALLTHAREDLCVHCHTDCGPDGPGHNHPLRGEVTLRNQALLASGGVLGSADNEILCQTCHLPHASDWDHLLPLPANDDSLCLACHEARTPNQWMADAGHREAETYRFGTHEMRQAAAAIGTRIGQDDKLICLSCHRLHRAPSEDGLLAETLQDSRICLRCHPDYGHVEESPHDLRLSAPKALNQREQTAVQSGPCGACHGFHRFNARIEPRPEDASGLCTGCHSAQSPDVHTPERIVHPALLLWNRTAPGEPGYLPVLSAEGTVRPGGFIACLTCHNPHGRRDVLCDDEDADGGQLSPAARQAARPMVRPYDAPNLCSTCHGFEGLWRYRYFHDEQKRIGPR